MKVSLLEKEYFDLRGQLTDKLLIIKQLKTDSNINSNNNNNNNNKTNNNNNNINNNNCKNENNDNNNKNKKSNNSTNEKAVYNEKLQVQLLEI